MSEIADKMQEVWKQATADKSNKPDLIICRPFPAWKGNLLRVLCHFFDHDWKPMKLVNITHVCDRCGATQVKMMQDLSPLDRSVYDWWRGKT